MTKAATRLGITQPALSKWLSGLEKEIGLSLVIRSKKSVIFTEAGQIYLNGCRQCLETFLKTQSELDRLSDNSRQSILLGGSPFRGAQAFARVFSDFREKYPDIHLQFIHGVNPELKQRLLNGEINMSLLGSTETSLSDLEYLKFMDEELLIMLPKGHPLSYDYKALPPNQPYPVIELSSLKDTPLMANLSTTSYTSLVLRLYQNAGLESNIVFRDDNIPLLYAMVNIGLGAALIPSAYFNPRDGISVYSLSPRLIVYQGIGLRRDHRLSEPEEYLIHLVMNSWGAPFYMHQYADYYLEERKIRTNFYEYKKA